MKCLNLSNNEMCQFIHSYSEIEGIQVAYQVTYAVKMTPNGALLSIKSEKPALTSSIVCLCPYMDYCKAEYIAKFLYENSVSVYLCQDIFDDFHIQYSIIEQKVC